jgi:hypothetical protein
MMGVFLSVIIFVSCLDCPSFLKYLQMLATLSSFVGLFVVIMIGFGLAFHISFGFQIRSFYGVGQSL